VSLTGGDYEAVVLPEDQELAGFVPLLSIAYQPVYLACGTDRVSEMLFEIIHKIIELLGNFSSYRKFLLQFFTFLT